MHKKRIIIILGLIFVFTLPVLLITDKTTSPSARPALWEVQSIDTMKYSRDIAREKLSDKDFEDVIDRQVRDIADTGATHVAIATPYDEEFYPFLKKWVDAARKHGLSVWFRGNFSGWEGWFDYPDISRVEHISKTEQFILENKDLFEDGDIFTPCPECENGGPGDPRHNGDLEGHREFLIDQYAVTKKAFEKIGKNVSSNFLSMNGDVARLVMDRETTQALDGVVTIDHYVRTPEQLVSDIKSIASSSGGRVVLGEFGAPIPDIHGDMSQEEQSQWLDNALSMLYRTDEVLGINYWTNTGSSTRLWDDDGEMREGANTIKKYFDAKAVQGKVEDEAGSEVSGAYIKTNDRRYFTDSDGKFAFPYIEQETSTSIQIEAEGYKTLEKTIKLNSNEEELIVLKKENEDGWYKIRRAINIILSLGR